MLDYNALLVKAKFYLDIDNLDISVLLNTTYGIVEDWENGISKIDSVSGSRLKSLTDVIDCFIDKGILNLKHLFESPLLNGKSILSKWSEGTIKIGDIQDLVAQLVQPKKASFSL